MGAGLGSRSEAKQPVSKWRPTGTLGPGCPQSSHQPSRLTSVAQSCADNTWSGVSRVWSGALCLWGA